MNLKENKDAEVLRRVDIVSVKLIRDKSMLYNESIKCPQIAVNLAYKFISDCDREMILGICLDIKCNPTSISIISIGSLNASIVHPREVFKTAFLSNAASIILVHNHPSGDPTPSPEDISITKRIQECGKLLGIELTDHIIIGSPSSFISLKERGII